MQKSIDKLRITNNKTSMTGKETYDRLTEIDVNTYAASVTAVEKEKLVEEVMVLRNAVLELGDICSILNTFSIEKAECFNDELDYLYDINQLKKENKALTEDNNRLKKAVHNIYEAFKAKSLQFIVNSDISSDDLKLFKEIFKSYLK